MINLNTCEMLCEYDESHKGSMQSVEKYHQPHSTASLAGEPQSGAQ